MFRKILLTVIMAGYSVVIATASLPDGNRSNQVINTFNRNFVYNAKKMVSAIKLDGILDEADWTAAQVAGNFRLVLPVDTGYPQQPSEILLTYDDKAFYMAITFFDTIEGKRIAESFRRDWLFGNNDNFLSFFDTFLDQTNGFTFGVSASGAVWDGTMHSGSGVSLDWDSKMESKTRHYDDRWVTEMRIPFKAVRYPRDSQTWYVNFSRQDLKTNEKSSWAPVPRQFPTASLAYTGVLNFDQPLPKPSLNLSVIPYLFSSYHSSRENGFKDGWRNDAGFDAKVGISSAMNLDLTYNPDFAQVEVDQQQMNVDRFELFYPEKRQFFLENSDLFAGYGYKDAVTPFFSRRIGLDAPVLAGARLSGKIGNDTRIGFMNMTTEKTGEQFSRNFTVFSVQRKMFARSNLGFILVNKEFLNQPEASELYNRVAGVDYNLASSSNFWNGKFFYHRSFQPGNPGKQHAQGASLGYSRKNINIRLSQTSVGDNYRAETGFVRRTGYNFFGPELKYIFVPNRRVAAHGPFAELEYYYNSDMGLIDQENSYGYQIEFRDRTIVSGGIKDFFVKLQNDFDPTRISEHVLSKGSEYRTQVGFVEFISDNRRNFKWQTMAAKGGFYNGDFNLLEGKMSYRYQPYASLSMNFTFTDLILPEPFERTQFWLAGPKLDLTFTDKLFLSTFVQYNEQIDNVNLNMRFQWRYQPVSDLFVVYTDNYIPGTWNSRNRALVFKITYWLN
jgi:hypothetical protein